MAANVVSISMKSERSINSKIIRRISVGKTVPRHLAFSLSIRVISLSKIQNKTCSVQTAIRVTKISLSLIDENSIVKQIGKFPSSKRK